MHWVKLPSGSRVNLTRIFECSPTRNGELWVYDHATGEFENGMKLVGDDVPFLLAAIDATTAPTATDPAGEVTEEELAKLLRDAWSTRGLPKEGSLGDYHHHWIAAARVAMGMLRGKP